VNKNPTDATVCRFLFIAKLNKYLHTVASVGYLFTLNYDARNHELKSLKIIFHLVKTQRI